MDLRSKNLSNPLLSSSLKSSSLSTKKGSLGLASTENKLLKSSSLKLSSLLFQKNSTASVERKEQVGSTCKAARLTNPLLSDSSLRPLLLKRKASVKYSPSNSFDGTSSQTASYRDTLTTQKTSVSKKRLLVNSEKQFGSNHDLNTSSQHHRHGMPSAGRVMSSTEGGTEQRQIGLDAIPYWERTISSDLAYPEYDFSMETNDDLGQEDANSFEKIQLQEDEEKLEVESAQMFQKQKQDFINSVSASLIGNADFHDAENANRVAISAAASEIIDFDPEFILKVALYTRKELNIRTTANFLLAFASYHKECRPFLKKYFQKSIALPSDWIEVAEIYLTFHDDSISFGALPSALRKAMTAKFPEFDKYQLAKYNKQKKQSDKKIKGKEEAKMKEEEAKMASKEDGDSDKEKEDQETEDIEKRSFNLKELIRKLHITDPVEHVMCLIGKKYPEDLEAFYKSRLPGTWESDRAGKRMKLPTPETWETQVSLKGNKAETWETLMDNRKLPFMAMLRNLRNMIGAGISPKHHSWIIKKLTDEGSVTNSKQFPFRFFSAYKVLEDMGNDLQKAESREENPSAEDDASGVGGFRGRGRGRGGGRGRGRGRGRGGPGEAPWRKKKVEKQLCDYKYDAKLLQRYRKALDTAVKIATAYNVKPIRGKTLILCSLTEMMWEPCTSARGLGKPKSVLEVGVLLGLMCKYSCEDCSFILCDYKGHEEVELEQGTILDNMNSVIQLARNMMSGISSYESMNSVLLEVIRNRQEFDTIVILADGWMKQSSEANSLRQTIATYRHLLNPNMLFVNIALKNSTLGVSSVSSEDHENDIYIAGFSDQILRFIAERGDTGQINHVENIDKAYSLKDLNVEKRIESTAVHFRIPEGPSVRRWRTVRVFISSTFKDMHGERDLLTRYVFPELRARARRLLVNIVEVDLRWGVTEEQTKQHKSVEVCLSEVAHCDYFIGILGERYGFVPEFYPAMLGSKFEWLAEYPIGRSMTELEVQQALQDHDDDKGAFFYIRDSSFIDDVPGQWKKNFRAESEPSRTKLMNLQDRILKSGCEVFNNYSCYWGGLVDGKPITAGLEEFGERVLNNLWTKISADFDTKVSQREVLEEEAEHHRALMDTYTSVFVGRKPQLIKFTEMMEKEKGRMFVLTGQQGCGKSAFMATLKERFVEAHPSYNYFSHFVGATAGSSQLLNVLTRICWTIKLTFNLFMHVPDDYKNLINKLPRFLDQASQMVCQEKFVIFIDGLDELEPANQVQSMEWLPASVPENVIIVVSCGENKECYNALQRRENVSVFNLGSLDILDKSEMVRKILGVYRKQLDESPFNNQMKLLISKRQANLALFLSLACEEIRMFGVFEEVSSKLKALSHTVDALLQEIISRLEKEYDENMIRQLLVLLACARDGLEEEELHHLLSLAYHLKNKKLTYQDVRDLYLSPPEFLPSAIFARLIRSVKTLINPGVEHSSRLRIGSNLILDAITHRYLRGTGADLRIQMHVLLAGFFCKLADPHGNGSLEAGQLRGISELPYHLTQAGLFNELKSVLCNLHYICACCKFGIASHLLDCYQIAGQVVNPSRMYLKEMDKFTSLTDVKTYSKFVSKCLHLIGQCPAFVWQEAINEPSTSIVSSDANKKLEELNQAGHRLVRWKNKSGLEHACTQTLSEFVEPVTCVDVSHDNSFFVCGTKDSSVKVYDMNTGKEYRSFHGHSDAITGICFVGKDRLVSASRDGQLSLWDIQQGHRLSEMKGHRRQVSWCCTDKGGSMIASASWDCTVKLWDGRNGKLVCTLYEKRPINCVAFHSGGRKLVTASWDATLKIWDTVDKKRLAVLRGHKSAIRSVAWSPNDVYLASASLDGAVMMWSADNGVMVGCLKGHSQPINQLRFAPSGLELVTVSDDHSLKVWSGTLGKQLFSRSIHGNPPATVCVFSTKDSCLATGFHNGMVSVMEVISKKIRFEVQHQESRVCGVAWCPVNENADGILVGYQSGIVEFLSGEDGCHWTNLTTSHVPVMAVAIANKIQLAAAAFENATVMIWELDVLKKDMEMPLLLCKLYAESAAPISDIAFSPDNLQLAAVTRDKMIVVWATDSRSLKKDKNEAVINLHGCHKDWITSCAWSDNGEYLVTGSNDCLVKLWHLKKQQAKVTMKGHSSAVTSVAFSHGCIVSGSTDGELKVWSHRGVEITTLHAHDRGVNCCDIYIPSGEDDDDEDNQMEDLGEGEDWATVTYREEWKEEHAKKKMDKGSKVKLEEVMVASAADDGTYQIWKPLQGNELCTLTGHADRVTAVGVAGNGLVVSASLDRAVKVWTPVHSNQSDFGVHTDAVTSVVQSPSGNIMVTTSRGGEATLWYRNPIDATDPGFCKVYTWKVFDCSINCAAFINDKRIIFGSNDGMLALWQVNNPKSLETVDVIMKQDRLLKTCRQPTNTATRPVSCMSYSVEEDILYVTTWNTIEITEGLAKGKWRQAVLSLSEWASCVRWLPHNTCVTGLVNKTKAAFVTLEQRNLTESVIELDMSSVACCLTPWKIGETEEARKTKLLFGLEDGSIFITDESLSEEERCRKVHGEMVTNLSVEGDIIITASADAKIKLWKNPDEGCSLQKLIQIGQFNCQAPISSMFTRVTGDNSTMEIICGDQLGQVYLLEF